MSDPIITELREILRDFAERNPAAVTDKERARHLARVCMEALGVPGPNGGRPANATITRAFRMRVEQGHPWRRIFRTLHIADTEKQRKIRAAVSARRRRMRRRY